MNGSFSSNMAEEKNSLPSVLVLGGTGFIGRNLVKHLVDKRLASHIRVCDKVMPMTAYFSPEITEAFKSVEFVHSDLSLDNHVENKVFNRQFDYVVNLCGETRCGMPENDYQQRTLTPIQKCTAAAAAQGGIQKWIEVSTAAIYQPKKQKSTEDGPVAPWTTVARFRKQAEEVVKNSQLPWVILRPSYVYGPGDRSSITPKLACAAVYKHRNKKMRFLWTKDLQCNTVHVSDVVNAIWTACVELRAGATYNLSDQDSCDQGKINEFIQELFGIKTGFLGKIVSSAASVNMRVFANSANEEHVPGWQRVCQQHQVLNTPVSPFIDKELLSNSHMAVDGSRIESESSFRYQQPHITAELVRQQLQGFMDQNLFPKQ